MTSNPTDLIRRLADEVEAKVVFRHRGRTREQLHPAVQKNLYDRDMAIVYEARRWIEEHGGEDV